MKLHLDGVNVASRTGPNTFALRLSKQLFESGHEVVFDDGRNADASIVFIEPTQNPLSKIVVQRLDGIWSKPNDFIEMNEGIKRQYRSADAVVFQSKFDETFICANWGAPRKHEVIRNGININPIVRAVVPPELERLRNKYANVFVSSANWHPQKRLNECVELYKHLRDACGYVSSALIVMGKNATMIADKHVYYAGDLEHETCLQVFAASDWMIHLAYADHSPNTVVESLFSGTPVICSEVGGTKELVDEFGIVLKENEEFKYEPFDYDRPPAIDVTQLTALPNKASLGSHADIDVKNVADSYIKLIESIVHGKNTR